MQCGYLDVTSSSNETAPCYKEKENYQFGVVCVHKGIKIKILNKVMVEITYENMQKKYCMNLTRQFAQSKFKCSKKICF